MSKIDFISFKTIDFCDDVRDGTHDSPKHLDFGKILITSKNIKGDSIDFENASYISEEDYNKINERSLVEINDVLYSMIGTVGLVYRVDQQPNYAIKNMGLFKIHDELKSKWLYYYLNSPKAKEKILSMLSGSTQKFISLGNLRNLKIEFPQNIDDAKKIIKICESIDRKIKLNNEINNNLYEFNNKLFEEKILNNEEKDDWEEYLLSDISKMINGYSYKGSELVKKSNIGMATIKNFERTGGFKLDGFKDIVPQKCKIDHYVKPFEILVACTDLTQNADIIGNAIMLLNNANYDEIIMSMDLVKLIPITDIVNNYMLYAIVNSKDFKNFALRYKSGTTVLHLNKNCFKEYTIKLPNYNTIKDLSKVFEGNYKKISQIVDENRKLEQLRDTLLPKLMNGEIDLDNIEI